MVTNFLVEGRRRVSICELGVQIGNPGLIFIPNEPHYLWNRFDDFSAIVETTEYMRSYSLCTMSLGTICGN